MSLKGQSWSHFVFYCTLMPDMDDDISSQLKLFAGNSLSYSVIHNALDLLTVQHDLEKLISWAQIKQMQFNPSKCYILRIHRALSPITHSIYSNPGSSGSSALLRCYPVWVSELEGTYPACQEQSYRNTSLRVSLGFIKPRNFHSCFERDKE